MQELMAPVPATTSTNSADTDQSKDSKVCYITTRPVLNYAIRTHLFLGPHYIRRINDVKKSKSYIFIHIVIVQILSNKINCEHVNERF